MAVKQLTTEGLQVAGSRRTWQFSSEAWGFRIGAAGAVVGSLLAGVGNLLHPTTPVRQSEGVARAIAESAAWAPIHLMIVAGLILILMFAGLVALSRVYPRWLGWVAVAMGLGCIVAGIIQALNGEPTVVTKTLTIIFPSVITLWTALLSVLLWRNVSEQGVRRL